MSLPAQENAQRNNDTKYDFQRFGSLKVSQAAKILGISPSSLRRFEEEGKITSERASGNDYRTYRLDLVNRLKAELQNKDNNKQLLTEKKKLKKVRGYSSKKIDGGLAKTASKLILSTPIINMDIPSAPYYIKPYVPVSPSIEKLDKSIKTKDDKEENLNLAEITPSYEKIITYKSPRSRLSFGRALSLVSALVVVSTLLLFPVNFSKVFSDFRSKVQNGLANVESLSNILSILNVRSGKLAEKKSITPSELLANVLATSARVSNYVYNFNIPVFFKKPVTFDDTLTANRLATFNAGINTTNVTFKGTGLMNNLLGIDTVTKTTLERDLDIDGQVTSTGMGDTVISKGVITGPMLNSSISYSGKFNFAGTIALKGTTITTTADEINTLSGVTYNNGGLFYGDGTGFAQDASYLFWDATTKSLGIGTTSPAGALTVSPSSANAIQVNPYGTLAGETGELRFYELAANGANYTGFKAPDTLSSDITYTLPSDSASSSDYVLTWQSSNILQWKEATSIGGTGDITQVGSVGSGAAFSDSGANGQWLGLGSSSGRISFVDTTTDYINLLGANVGIGTSSPAYTLDISGNINTLGLYISGTQVTANASELNLLDGRTGTLVDSNNVGTYAITSLTAGSGLSGGTGPGAVTINVGAGNGISVSADSITINLLTSGTSANTSANSGLEVGAGGLRMIGGCGNEQVLAWNSASDKWECQTAAGLGETLSGSGVANQLAYFTGDHTQLGIAVGTDGQILLGVSSSAPAFGTMSGDATISNNGLLTLANTGVVSGTYGSTTLIPVLSVDNKGRIISATNVSGYFETPLTFSNGLTRSGTSVTLGGALTQNTRIYSSSDPEMFFLDNTNSRVGIGTTGPNYKLDVNGTANIANTLSVNGGSSTTWDILTPPSDHYIIGFDDLGTYYGLYQNVSTATMEVRNLNFTISGNVGIGTTAPTDRLDVSGGVKIGSGYAGIGTTAPLNGLLVQGKVGIGTTNPTYTLEVNGTARVTGEIVGDGSLTLANDIIARDQLRIGDADNTTFNYIANNVLGASSAMASNLDLYIQGNLEVSGAVVSSSGSGTFGYWTRDAGISTISPAFSGDTVSIPGPFIVENSSTVKTTAATAFIVENGSSVDTFTVNTASNIVNVYGTLNTTGAISAPTNTNTINGLVINGGNITSGTWSGDNISLGKGGTGASLVDPNADRVMFWDESSNSTSWLTVGVGLSLSGTELTATAGTPYTAGNGLTLNNQEFELGGTLNRDTTINLVGYNLAYNINGIGNFDVQHNGTSVFYVKDGGNVGIGTTNPTYNLDVNGNINTLGLYIAGTQVTAGASEINVLDGITANTSELNILDGVTASATELNLLVGRSGTLLDSANVGTYATTGVTAGSGLSGGGTTGALTLDIGAGNGITVSADSIAVNLATSGTSATTSSTSGLEVASSGLRMLGGCSNGQILSWNSSSVKWECQTVTGISGVLSGSGVANQLAYFTGTNTQSGISVGTNGQLLLGVTGSAPAFGTLSGDATLSNTGVLTLADTTVVAGTYGSSTIIPVFSVDSKGRVNLASTAAGNFQPSNAGLTDISSLAKTDGNIIVGNGTNWVAESGATARTSLGLGTGDSPNFAGLYLSGTQVTSSATELNLLVGRSGTLLDSANVGTYATTGVTAGSGLSGGGTTGALTLDIGAGNGITVSADSIAVNLATSGTSATTSSTSGLEVASSGLRMLGGCSNGQILSWNSSSVKWECQTVTGISGVVAGSGASGQVTFWTGATSIAGSDNFFWDSGAGKLGLGTTSPTSKLTINPADAAGLQINPFGTNSGETSEFRLLELAANGTNYTGFKAPNSVAADVIYTLPSSSGSSDFVLTWQSSNVLQWKEVTSVGGAGDITKVGSITSGDAFSDSSASGQWLGLGAIAGRIEFDDQSTDEINFLNANVGIGTTNPTYTLDVSGTIRATSAITAPTSINTINGLVISSGNITAGTWNGDTISVGRGGTGAITLTANGVVLGAGTGPLSATTGSGGQLLVVNSSSIPAFMTLSGDGTLSNTGVLTLADTTVVAGTYGSSTIIPVFSVDSKGRVNLASTAAGNFQPSNAGLTDISSLAKTDGNIIVGNGTNWVAESGATARTSLGLGTGDSPNFAGLYLSGTQVTSSATELNLLVGRSGTLLDSANVGTYATTGVTAGSGLSGGGTTGALTLDIGAGNGITVSADSIAVNLATSGTSATTSSTSGLEVASSGLRMLGGCANGQILSWNSSSVKWECYTIPTSSGGSGTITAVGSMTSGDAFSSSSASNQWLGLGAAAGRISFIDSTTDYINLMSANVGIGVTSPAYELEVNGSILGGGVLLNNSGDIGFGAVDPDLISLASGAVTINGSLATTGTINSLTISTGNITAGTWSGDIILVPYGGTGAAALTDHSVLLGSGTGPITALAVGTTGQLLLGVTGNDPAFATMTGDATISGDGTLTLVSTSVVAGTYGNTTNIPQITVDNKGRITAVANQAISYESPLTFTNGLTRTDNDVHLGGVLSENTRIYSSSGPDILFLDNTNSRVGIGTTAPTYTLDVTGTIRSTGTITAPASTNTINGLVINAGNITTGTWNGDTILVPRGGTGLSTLTANGVLIGTGTGPVSMVIGTGGQLLVINSSSAPTFATLSGDGTISNAGVLTLASTSVVAGSYGTSTQIPVFTVDSKGRLTAASYQTISYESSLTFSNGLTRNSNDTHLGGQLSENTRIYSSSGPDIFFLDNTNSRVGIGNTTPSYKLDTALASNGIIARFSATDASLLIGANANGGYIQPGTVDKTTIYQSNGTSAVVTVDANKVGIGTTAPGVSLDVVGQIRSNSTITGNGLTLAGYTTNSSVLLGKAKVMNTGNYLDFTNYNSNVTIDLPTGNISGYAWLEDLGWVAFGTSDNPLGPVNVNISTGLVTGKAKVLNTGAYLDFNLSPYGSNVVANLTTRSFSGYVFSEDLGWIDFTDTGVQYNSLGIITTSISDQGLNIDPSGAGIIYFHGTTYKLTSTGDLTIGNNLNFYGTGVKQISTNDTNLAIMTGTGFVGIGMTSPGSKLSVAGGTSIGSTYAGISAPTDGMIIQGNVGIGTTNPLYTLTVNGTSWTTNNAWAGSDIRWKQNIQPITGALDKVLQLNGVSYNWRTDEFPQNNFDNKTHLGLIAQDVENIVPELVTTGTDGYKGLDYNGFSALLINAIGEQQTQILSLSGQLANLSLPSTSDLQISQSAGSTLPIVTNIKTGVSVDNISAFAQSVIGELKAGSVNTQKLNTELVTIGGQTLQDYIGKIYLTASTNTIGKGTTSPSEISMLDIDGTIRINQTIIPTTALDSLYNNAGVLFWNNKQISTGPDLYSVSGSVPDGDYLSLEHNQGTNDILVTAWVNNGTKWIRVTDLSDSSDTASDYYYSQPDNNTVRLHNKSEHSQSLKLDVFVSGADVAEWYTPENIIADTSINTSTDTSISTAVDTSGASPATDISAGTSPSTDIVVDTNSAPSAEIIPSGSSSGTPITTESTSVPSATKTNTEIESGDVVAISTNFDDYGMPIIRKTSAYYDSGSLGVVTLRASHEMGIERDGRKLVALSGRVLVKIDTASSDIKPGDFIAASSLDGYAIKAEMPGRVIGTALQSWNKDSGEEKILVLVNPTYNSPTSQTTASASLTGSSTSGDILNELLTLRDEIITLSNNLKDTLASIGMSLSKDEITGKDILVVNSDMNILGDATLANLTITGNIQAGMITIDTLSNSIDILGPSCYNSETGSIDNTLCKERTLHLQKSGSGMIDMFDGKIVAKPDGTLVVEKSIETKKLIINTTDVASASAGKTTIKAGNISIVVNTSAVNEKSIIMVTPERPIIIGSKYKDNGRFEISLKETQSQDLDITWMIVDRKD